SAASFIPQITSVGTFTLGNACSSHCGRGTVTPGGGTTTFAARYQLSIAVNAPGCDQSAIYCRFSASGILVTSVWRSNVLSKKVTKPTASAAFSNPGARNALMYCDAERWSASSIRLFWKITGCG